MDQSMKTIRTTSTEIERPTIPEWYKKLNQTFSLKWLIVWHQQKYKKKKLNKWNSTENFKMGSLKTDFTLAECRK